MSFVEPLESRTLLSITPSVGILASLANASETNPMTTGHGSFEVVRTGSTKSKLVVKYQVHSSSTATSGIDFIALKGTVTIPAGQTFASIRLVPIDDSVHEGNETVTLYLTSAAIAFSKHRSATVTIHDNDAAPADWWNDSCHYREPITVDPGTFARTDQAVDQQINFTSILNGLHRPGSLILNSIRVVETDANHSLIDANVPFQFDQASNFSARWNASGDLVFMMTGSTAASTPRHFDVYFDTTGSFSAPNITPLVSVTNSVSDNYSDDSFKITTTNPSNGKDTSYVIEKDNGGISSILDDDGNDWVSSNPTLGSAGTYRGFPNLGVPGGAHPGFDSGTVTMVSNGPIKTVFNVVSTDKQVALTYEFYPTFLRVTVTKANEPNGNPDLSSGNENYWFLYEATPGGGFTTTDTSVQSDGTTNTLDTNWDADNSIGNGTDDGEWVYFNHAANNRYIFLAHDTPDNLEDSYYDLDNNMTVFGFGRTGLDHGQLPQMTDTPNVFTVGLDEGGDDFSASSATINGTYRPITLTPATAEIQ